MTDKDEERRDAGGSTRPGAVWLNEHKGSITAGVVTAVVSKAISDAFGGALAWLVQAVAVVLTVVIVGIVIFRLRERFPKLTGPGLPGPPPPPAPSETSGRDDEPRPARRWVIAAAVGVLVLWTITVVTDGGTGGGGGSTPTPPVTDAPSPSPTLEPEEPVSFTGQLLEDVQERLRAQDVDVKFEARPDSTNAAGTILEQDPDPLAADDRAVTFVVSARRRIVEIDEDFLAHQSSGWQHGPQSVFGYPHEQTFFVKDADCIEDGGYYDCQYRRRTPLLALALKRQFEVFSAVIGFEDRGPSDKSLVEVVTYGVGTDEDGETVCIAEVGPTLAPLRLRVDVSGQLRLEVFYRPWRGRQIPVVGSPKGVAVDVGLLSPPVTGLKNLFPPPPQNSRCFA